MKLATHFDVSSCRLNHIVQQNICFHVKLFSQFLGEEKEILLKEKMREIEEFS
jgi:hypothetical protein